MISNKNENKISQDKIIWNKTHKMKRVQIDKDNIRSETHQLCSYTTVISCKLPQIQQRTQQLTAS